VEDKTIAVDAAPPSVLVVILNWNGWEETLKAADSILRQDYANLRVLVIDNGSADGSVAQLRAIRNDRVELLELPENRGFTGGCNEGFKRALVAGAHYVWLFNSDAVNEDEGVLTSLVALAESDPNIGLVSPRIAEPGEDCRLTLCGGVCSTDPFFWDYTHDPEEARRWALQFPNAGFVSGAAMLVKSSLIRKIGMLDEKFFAYYEDHDYSYRSSMAGFRNLWDENSMIRHAEKDAKLNPLAIKPHWWYYVGRNPILLWRKHLGGLRALKPCWWSLNSSLRLVLRCRKYSAASDAMFAGLWHGLIKRGGAYRPEYRMPRMLAAAVWKYALARPALSASVATAPQGDEAHTSN
jgi:GT2 family glycosyltransferase